jgi:hypothetical protein
MTSQVLQIHKEHPLNYCTDNNNDLRLTTGGGNHGDCEDKSIHERLRRIAGIEDECHSDDSNVSEG